MSNNRIYKCSGICMASNIIKGMGITCMLFVFGSKKVTCLVYDITQSQVQMLVKETIRHIGSHLRS